MHRVLRRSCLLALCVLTLSIAALAAPRAECTLSTQNRTVTICTPANGATVSTTFHVNAGATDSSTVKYMQVYVENKLYGTQYTNVFDAMITVPAGSHQNLVVQARDATGFMKTTYHINVVASSPFTLSPLDPTVSEGGTQQFTASAAATWKSSCGSITSAGLFTAPLSQTSCTITATATDGSGHTATTNADIASPITISPNGATTVAGATQQFTASESVSWSASCGSITPAGLFTAPATAGACTITATASSGTLYSASVIDTVTAAPASTNYTTWKNDNARDGLQSNETSLTPSNVNASTFGRIFSFTTDDAVWAQTLYMTGVSVQGVVHNVVYAATANDSVYAVDAENGTQLWKVNLLGKGETQGDGTKLHSSLPKIGITGTPVIDSTTGAIYLVSFSCNSSGTCFHRLHALDVSSGEEKFGGPAVITSSGFDSSQHLQRPGLLLANGNVYIAFGSNDDILPYHGWVFAYRASTLAQVAVWNDTPNGTAGGIWMGASGIPADASGNLFFSTGNGDWEANSEYGESVVELSYTLTVLDYFTPYDDATQSAGDKDLGSGGVLLLPTSSGTYPHEAISCSKLNRIYVLNRDALGQHNSSTDDVIQTVTGQLGATSGLQYTDRCFSTPAFWNNNLYFIGNNDSLKQFTFNPNTGLMGTTPIHKDTFAYLFPGGQPVVSAHGNNDAIVWAVDWTTGTLHAYDATNVSKVLYVSPALGTGIKFTVPTVANGHVYVGMVDKVVGLGLLPSGGSCTPPASPGAVICSPAQGSTENSPVAITAAGTGASGTVNHMELWIDGKKINNYFSNQLSTSVALAAGSHAITAVEVDSTGAYLKSTPVTVTVR